MAIHILSHMYISVTWAGLITLVVARVFLLKKDLVQSLSEDVSVVGSSSLGPVLDHAVWGLVVSFSCLRIRRICGWVVVGVKCWTMLQ